MALKTFKPVTPSLRQLVLVDRRELYKGKPVGEGADQHPAHGTHHVADPEQGERGEQAVGRAVRGEEGRADRLGA